MSPTAVKEYPIPFQGDMVRAILENRKWVTRRTSKRWAKVRVGDRLWVRESWCVGKVAVRLHGESYGMIVIRGPLPKSRPDDCILRYSASWQGKDLPTMRPSMFMPRWASRITLEVVSVREERLQDITEADARAEGCDAHWEAGWREGYCITFANLWDSINGKKDGNSWADNPTVYRIEFRRIET